MDRIRAWERELDGMSGENGRVVMNAVTVEDKKLVDHFDNQFTIQKNRLDQMKHNVKLTGGHPDLRKELDDFGVHFDKLNAEFIAFSEVLL